MRKNDLGATISIASYTSTKYTFPEDGYVLLGGGPTAGSGPIVRLFGSASTGCLRLFNITPVDNQGSNLVFFVRKGMKIQVEQMVGLGAVQYCPLA